ncbi:MAG: hypothetical protein AB9M60_10370 [Leptothrix sp. (in: b-proteobacteria)]
MQRWMKVAVMAAMWSGLAVSQARTDVGVSIEISQPGVFGRVDIGQFPQPQVVQQRPIIIMPPPRNVVIQQEPVYLWVPPGHQRDWRHHCQEYGACGVPVYFVRERWYQDNVYQVRGQDGGDRRRMEWDRGDRGGDQRGDNRGGHGDRRDRRHREGD